MIYLYVLMDVSLRPHQEIRPSDLSYICLSGNRVKSILNRTSEREKMWCSIIFSNRQLPYNLSYFSLWRRFKKLNKDLNNNLTLYSFRLWCSIYKRTDFIKINYGAFKFKCIFNLFMKFK